MEVIKQKINIKNISGPISFNILLTQTMDNIGMFTDHDYYGTLVHKDITLIDKFGRPDNSSLNSWFTDETVMLSGITDSKLDNFKTYNLDTPFVVNFDIDTNIYTDYLNNYVNSVTRVVKFDDNEKIYVFDAENDINIGTDTQTTGIRYIDANGVTKFMFIGQGNNETNSSIKPIIKEDYLIGITDVLETKNDIFIDRGGSNIMENILKMSEVNNLNQLVNFGNGFFKITKI